MAMIPFIQYLRPNGRKTWVRIDRPDNIAAAADKIRSHGFRFEVEQLMDSSISMTISDDDGDYACRVCSNDEAVPLNVDALITEFDLAAAIKKRDSAR